MRKTLFSLLVLAVLFSFTSRVMAQDPGDVNRDGVVNVDDIDLIAEIVILDSLDLFGTLQPVGVFAPFDVDQDGAITLRDRTFLIENLIPSPCGMGTIVGDMNFDGSVDVLGDAFILVGNLGDSFAQGDDISYAQGDINGDGQVDVLGDAFLLIANLGQTCVDP